MNKLFTCISFALFVLLAGCANEIDTLTPQQDKIVSFLTQTHQPKLFNEADLEPTSQSPYYTTVGSTVYRYIPDVRNPYRDEWTEVTRTSKVTITFRAYVFTYANIVTTGNTQTMPFYTNDSTLQAALENVGLNTSAWSFEPLEIDMRHPGIIKGLYDALLGCRESDYVEAYMTYSAAYGDTLLGPIPKESPIAYFFTINSVE